LGPEAIASVLVAGTAIRLISGPIAGRLADILDAPKAVLAACSATAALIVLGYLQGTELLLLFVVTVLQSAALAPLAPFTDTLLYPRILPSNASTMAGCVVLAPRRSFAESCSPVGPSRNSGLPRLFGSMPDFSPRRRLPLASCEFSSCRPSMPLDPW
jgi:MFS family permease